MRRIVSTVPSEPVFCRQYVRIASANSIAKSRLLSLQPLQAQCNANTPRACISGIAFGSHAPRCRACMTSSARLTLKISHAGVSASEPEISSEISCRKTATESASKASTRAGEQYLLDPVSRSLLNLTPSIMQNAMQSHCRMLSRAGNARPGGQRLDVYGGGRRKAATSERSSLSLIDAIEKLLWDVGDSILGIGTSGSCV